MKPSACGYYFGVFYCESGWYVIGFSSRGDWKCSYRCADEQEARKHRSYMRRHHRKLAAERAKRSSRRTPPLPPKHKL